MLESQSKLMQSLISRHIQNIYQIILKQSLILFSPFMTSFNKQQRFTLPHQTIPGVGNYDTDKWRLTSRTKTTQSVSIGKSKRKSLQSASGIPGPGSYNLSFRKQSGPNPCIIGKPKEFTKTQIPGPGSYTPDTSILLATNPKFSFTGNNFHIKEDRKPGPCDYSPDIKAIARTDPVVSFSTQKRNSKDSHAEIPGPGKYNTQTTREHSTTFTFGSEMKFKADNLIIKEKGKLPGPGQYKSNSTMRARGGKFLSSKRQTYASTCLPGPGDYDTSNFKKMTAPTCIIAKSPRSKSQKEENPGFKYEVPAVQLYKKSMRKSQMSFTRGKKIFNYSTLVPGPGAYDSNRSTFQGSGITLKGQLCKQIKHDGPGPLDYHPNFDAILQKSPCTRIGGQNRQSLGVMNKIPGPTDYKVEDDYRVKSFYFGKSTSVKMKETTPGPGHYKIRATFGQLPSYIQSSKFSN